MSYITKRNNGIYSFRIVVPQHLLTKFGKREIWCSLKTREKRIAIERAGEKVGYYNRLFYYDTISDDGEPSFYDAKSAADRMGFPYIGSTKLDTCASPNSPMTSRFADKWLKNF